MKNKISSTLIYIGYSIVIISVLLSAINIYKDYKTGVESLTVLDKIMNDLESNTTDGEDSNKQQHKYEIDETYSDMPTVKVDGKHYIGIVHIPALSLSLPIQSDWSYELLNTSACRFYGSIEENNLILMSHNYRSQFGDIYKLKMNDEVTFIDVTGKKYKYKVIGSETIHKTEPDKMIDGDWDLTLFTCDFTRVNRTAIRFARSDSY